MSTQESNHDAQFPAVTLNEAEPSSTSEQKEEAKSVVETLISKNKTMVFGKSFCPYTKKVIDLFISLSIPYESLMLDLFEEGKFIQDYLFEKTHVKGVPRIFIGGNHIGGASDLMELHESGNLLTLYVPANQSSLVDLVEDTLPEFDSIQVSTLDEKIQSSNPETIGIPEKKDDESLVVETPTVQDEGPTAEVQNASSLVGLVEVLSHKNSVNSVKIDDQTVACGEAVVTKTELFSIEERRGSFAEYQPEIPEDIVIGSPIVETFEESTEDVIRKNNAASSPQAIEEAETTPYASPATPVSSNDGEIILYDHLLAYYPSRARLALNEKGIPYTHKLIDIFNGESLQPDFIRLTIKGQPCGSLPVLQQNDLVITESKELCEYVDSIQSKYSSGPFGPSIPQSEVQKWVDLIHPWNGNIYAAGKATGAAKSLMSGLNQFKIKFCLARALENPDLKDIYERKAKILGHEYTETEYLQNQIQLEGILDKIEKQLNEFKYVCGDEYTLADVFLTCMIFRVLTTGTDLFQDRPKLKGWYDLIQLRPSFQRTFKDARVQKHPALAVVGALAPALICKLTGRC